MSWDQTDCATQRTFLSVPSTRSGEKASGTVAGLQIRCHSPLSRVMWRGHGWVANDIHSESVSRTLDYAYDDHAVALLSTLISGDIVQGNTPNLDEIAAGFYNSSSANTNYNITSLLNHRSLANPWTVWNDTASAPALATGGEDIKGFVQARQQNGDWAGINQISPYHFEQLPQRTASRKETAGFTLSPFVHDVAELVERRGGNESFVKSLNEFYDGGWVDFTNEPAHHTPYLYALAGAASYTQEQVREIAKSNYNNTPNGLSGNEDCGQMSAWYVFSAMGFYPVNPVSGIYVVGSPFFSSLNVSIPVPPFIPPSHPSITSNSFYNSTTNSYDLRILAPGAESKPYVRSLKVNGGVIGDEEEPLISHKEIRFGGLIEFEMSDKAERWGVALGSANKPIFTTVARSHVVAAMEGFNAVIFAYGQTASGKTYTLSGCEVEPGIIPRAMRQVFSYIRRTETREYLLRCSYLEIYNEQIHDLLAPPGVPNKVELQGGTVNGDIILAPLREEVAQPSYSQNASRA
ncbi:glycosyl hydrolase family 92-domain-containing protein [Lentinula edodes]|uniref:Glycosyl hydrolase family 92-domain-containing protein n=1 Tax=Lentinula lateritia TaxID=40482 RepID=A0A9W9DWJ4_9AGAR|nr:glycosyl hydrolase family 92-domain-containing protein [Lentinula edodes]